jgi:hypothetical protein
MAEKTPYIDAKRRSADRAAPLTVRMPAAERQALEQFAAQRGTDLGSAVREVLAPKIRPFMESA